MVLARTHDWRPLAVSGGLAVLVLLYDSSLKRTPLGPVAMGGCRFLNVLLGMSLAAEHWSEVNYWVAGGIGLYIVGVTWFARNEAKETIFRGQLLLATLVIVAGMALLAWFPRRMDPASLTLLLQAEPERWYWFWLLLGAFILWRLRASDFRSALGFRPRGGRAVPDLTHHARRRGELCSLRHVGPDRHLALAAAADLVAAVELCDVSESAFSRS